MLVKAFQGKVLIWQICSVIVKTIQNSWANNIKQNVSYHTRITHDKFGRNEILNHGKLHSFLILILIISEMLHGNCPVLYKDNT